MSTSSGFRIIDAVAERPAAEICSVFNQRIAAANIANSTTFIGRTSEVGFSTENEILFRLNSIA